MDDKSITNNLQAMQVDTLILRMGLSGLPRQIAVDRILCHAVTYGGDLSDLYVDEDSFAYAEAKDLVVTRIKRLIASMSVAEFQSVFGNPGLYECLDSFVRPIVVSIARDRALLLNISLNHIAENKNG